MKQIRKALFLAAVAAFLGAFVLSACAIFGQTPEAQLLNSANTLTASTRTTTALLSRKAITNDQARTYRAVAASTLTTMNDAEKLLIDCRKKTASTPKTSPDPCKTTTAADIGLALQMATSLEATLKAKE